MARVARAYQPARPGSRGLDRLPPPHTHPWVHQSADLRVYSDAMSAPFARFTSGRHGSDGRGLRVYGFTLVFIPHTVHMVSIVLPIQGSPVCGLTGLHRYNASCLYERQTWFTGSGFTGSRGYTPLHPSRCATPPHTWVYESHRVHVQHG